MKKHLNTDDLSAYLDGEHRNEDGVRKHLQQCATCAREYVALQTVSAHVKALPEPEITFGFQARVMRAIEQSESAVPASRPRYWISGFATTAAAVAFVAGLTFLQGTDIPSEQEAPSISTQLLETGTSDLAGQLGPSGAERMIASIFSTQPGEMQFALASETATRAVPSEYFSGSDYNAGMFQLNDSEKETLFQLLGSSIIDEHMM